MRPIHRFAVLLPLIAACAEGPLDPGRFELDGAWLGRGYPFQLELDLEQDGENRVTGTGEVSGLREILETVRNPADSTRLDTVRIDTVVTSSVEFDVAGNWDYPNFQLRLTAEGYADAQYDAAYTSADSIRGTLRGSGFTNPTIVIVRQDGGG